MGQTVECECGQRNDLGVFGFGEERLCLSCGRSLRVPRAMEEDAEFRPVAPDDAFPEDLEVESRATGFESPTVEGGGDVTGEEAPVPNPQTARVWADGIRESGSEVSGEHCSRCGRAFRGVWDRQETPSGPLCHVCFSRAPEDYQRPSLAARRELYRPEPPKSVPPPEAENRAAERAKKNREMIRFLLAGGVVVLLLTMMPIEVWMAALFSTDYERAVELPVAWHWVVRVLNFVARAIGQGVGLYVTLAMMNLLYEEREQNLRSIIYLAIVFSAINGVVSWMAGHFGVFGIAAGILMAMALGVAFIIQLLMIAEQFPLRMEGIFGFVIAWFICSLVLGPSMRMVEWLLGGIVAAIAL